MAPQRQHDPTLPPPWEALFDPDSGLRYYWNPETNVTQYERPIGAPIPPVLAPPAAYVSPARGSSPALADPFCFDVTSKALHPDSVCTCVTGTQHEWHV